MYFTKEDYAKIDLYLKNNAKKDTDFPSADLPLTGKETMAIVQKDYNVQLPLEEIGPALKEGSITLPKIDPDAVKSIINTAVAEVDPIIVEGDVTNAPDEEDLTSDSNDLLKFKDKLYSPITYSGLGRKYLRKNLVNGVNTLTQDMFKAPNGTDDLENTIFIIQYDYIIPFDSTITIPTSCVLKFEGGSIGGSGTLAGQDTIVVADSFTQIFDSTLTVSGTYKNDCYADWFGAKCTTTKHTTSDVTAIQKALDSGFGTIKFNAGYYFLDSAVVLKSLKKIECVVNDGGDNFDENSVEGTVFYTKSNINCFKIQLDNMSYSYHKRLNVKLGTFLIDANVVYTNNVLELVLPYMELWYSKIWVSGIQVLSNYSTIWRNSDNVLYTYKRNPTTSDNAFDNRECSGAGISISAIMTNAQGQTTSITVGGMTYSYSRIAYDVNNMGTLIKVKNNSNSNGGMYICDIYANAFGFKDVISAGSDASNTTHFNLYGHAHSCGRIVNSINSGMFSHGTIKMICQTASNLFVNKAEALSYPWISGKFNFCNIDCEFWDTGTSTVTEARYSGGHLVNVDLSNAGYGVTLSDNSRKGYSTAYINLGITQDERSFSGKDFLTNNIKDLVNLYATPSYIKKLDNELLCLNGKGGLSEVNVTVTNLIYRDFGDITGDDLTAAVEAEFKKAFDEDGCGVWLDLPDNVEDASNSKLEIVYKMNHNGADNYPSRIRNLIVHRNGYGTLFDTCKLSLLDASSNVLFSNTYNYPITPGAVIPDILVSVQNVGISLLLPSYLKLEFTGFRAFRAHTQESEVTSSLKPYYKFSLFIEGGSGLNRTPSTLLNRVYAESNLPTYMGKWYKGIQSYVPNSVYSKPAWWNGTKWVDENGFTFASKQGATSGRPTLTAYDIGFKYFDTTINKPIWWNGTNWVDATGAVV